MYSTTGKDEVIIRLVGKLTLEFPDIDQFKVREIAEEVLYKYDIIPQETALVASDVEDKIQMYLAVKKLDGLSNKTIINYRYNLMIFADYLRKPLATIDVTDLRIYLANRCQNMKPSSKNGQITIIKTFFTWLTDEEYIQKNPAKKLKQTKEPKRLRHAMSKMEVEQLRNASSTAREKALVNFIYSTGCRLSEIVNIDIKDINWSDRSLCVIGKGDKEREVFFDSITELYLKNYLNLRNDDCSALFITIRKKDGKYRRLGGRSIEKEIHKIAAKAGIDKSVFPHLLRHSFATHKLNNGVPIHIVQGWLGHTDPATTQIYAETSRENSIHEYKRVS